MTLALLIQLVTSALTFLGMWLVGRKDWRGWVVGIVNQGFWFATIATTGAWGILPLSAGLLGIYVRALVAWRRDDKALEYVVATTGESVLASDEKEVAGG